jgi:hypothetical protein
MLMLFECLACIAVFFLREMEAERGNKLIAMGIWVGEWCFMLSSGKGSCG